MTHAISKYPVPKLEELPDDIRNKMLEVQKKAGFIRIYAKNPQIADLIDMRPNDEFYLLGRLPPAAK